MLLAEHEPSKIRWPTSTRPPSTTSCPKPPGWPRHPDLVASRPGRAHRGRLQRPALKASTGSSNKPSVSAAARCGRLSSAGQLGSDGSRTVGSGLGPDMIRYRAAVLDHPLRLKVADRLAVGVAQLIRGAAGQHGPGPLDQLAGDRDAGLGCGNEPARSSDGGRSRPVADLAAEPRSRPGRAPTAAPPAPP
jgi:hypothetical protein